MGKKSFIILFAIVSIVMIYTGLEYFILMRLVTNNVVQIIAVGIYDIGFRASSLDARYYNTGYNWFNVVTIIFIISFLISIVINTIITKIIYVILKIISSIELAGSGSGGTDSGRTYSGGNNTNNIDFKKIMDSWHAPIREFNERYNENNRQMNERNRQMERDREIEDRAREARNRLKQNW
ncbi:MAG: hypothetical protein KKG76_06355 [Euryarchaeota archaeon]|nr:hypothetical protein [Euryarchaeota archaeon]